MIVVEQYLFDIFEYEVISLLSQIIDLTHLEMTCEKLKKKNLNTNISNCNFIIKKNKS